MAFDHKVCYLVTRCGLAEKAAKGLNLRSFRPGETG